MSFVCPDIGELKNGDFAVIGGGVTKRLFRNYRLGGFALLLSSQVVDGVVPRHGLEP